MTACSVLPRVAFRLADIANKMTIQLLHQALRRVTPLLYCLIVDSHISLVPVFLGLCHNQATHKRS